MLHLVQRYRRIESLESRLVQCPRECTDLGRGPTKPTIRTASPITEVPIDL